MLPVCLINHCTHHLLISGEPDKWLFSRHHVPVFVLFLLAVTYSLLNNMQALPQKMNITAKNVERPRMIKIWRNGWDAKQKGVGGGGTILLCWTLWEDQTWFCPVCAPPTGSLEWTWICLTYSTMIKIIRMLLLPSTSHACDACVTAPPYNDTRVTQIIEGVNFRSQTMTLTYPVEYMYATKMPSMQKHWHVVWVAKSTCSITFSFQALTLMDEIVTA